MVYFYHQYDLNIAKYNEGEYTSINIFKELNAGLNFYSNCRMVFEFRPDFYAAVTHIGIQSMPI